LLNPPGSVEVIFAASAVDARFFLFRAPGVERDRMTANILDELIASYLKLEARAAGLEGWFLRSSERLGDAASSSSSRVTVSGLDVNSNSLPFAVAGREVSETRLGSSRLFITSDVSAPSRSCSVWMVPAFTKPENPRDGILRPAPVVWS